MKGYEILTKMVKDNLQDLFTSENAKEKENARKNLKTLANLIAKL